MPNESGSGAMPGESSPSDATSTAGTSAQPDASGAKPEAEGREDGERREDGAEGLRRALDAEREQRKRAEREARDARAEIAKRDDAGKSEDERRSAQLARETERANVAEAKLAELERRELARQIATEAGIPSWADELQGDSPRELRAHATRIRERLGIGEGSLDGGARGLGGPAQPESMDDLIRAGARRRSG